MLPKFQGTPFPVGFSKWHLHRTGKTTVLHSATGCGRQPNPQVPPSTQAQENWNCRESDFCPI